MNRAASDSGYGYGTVIPRESDHELHPQRSRISIVGLRSDPRIRFDARNWFELYDGPGFGKDGTGVLPVDDKEVASKKIPHTTPFVETIDETFDVGVDTSTGVEDKDYQPPYRFTGKVDKLTI